MRRRCHAAEGSGHRETRPWASPSSSSIIPSGLWMLRSRDSTRGRGSRISLHDVWLVMPHTPLSVRPTGAGEPFRDLAASGTSPQTPFSRLVLQAIEEPWPSSSRSRCSRISVLSGVSSSRATSPRRLSIFSFGPASRPMIGPPSARPSRPPMMRRQKRVTGQS